MNPRQEQLEAFGRLLDIMDDLRAKCPWDKKQTLQTLRHLTLEEVYELSDALLKEDLSEIKKELGDVLLHLVFYAKIGSEKNSFDIADVINSLNEKLIFRHPHIYGDAVSYTHLDVYKRQDEDYEDIAEELRTFRKVLINAKILDETGEEWKFNEGCLSIPDVREDVKLSLIHI